MSCDNLIVSDFHQVLIEKGESPMKRSPSKSGNPTHHSSSKPACGAGSRRLPVVAFGAGLTVLLLGGILMVGTAAAPHSETTATADQAVTITPDPPGTIDGAKNPELIPDEVALQMIVLAVAEPADATEVQQERARAKLRPIGFNEDDAAALLSLLAEFQTQAATLDKQAAEVYVRAPIPHPASTEYELLIDLGKQKDRLIANTIAAMPAKLTAEGFQQLLAYLPEAKKGIKIFPDANLDLMPKD